jgi:eukaryotic-like serine/threonine-protein kinase
VIGEVVGGRYRVVRQIAAGGMGVIWEAVHVVTGRRVALKIIRIRSIDVEDRPTWMARFAREARAVGGLDSPHIAEVFDASTDDATGQPFMAMELLNGEDVGQLLKRTHALPPEVALRVVGQACVGLARAHRAGIIHRDIKPGNLFLAHEDDTVTVKLLDFGVAKLEKDDRPESTEGELTRTGAILGTPSYMSPEQAMGLKQMDQRADLWSLGVVLYRLLCGSLPHPNLEGTGQLIVAICTQPAPSVQIAAPWVPPEIAAIVRRALKIDQQQRYQTAEEMLADIFACVNGSLELTPALLESVPEEQRTRVAVRYSERPTMAAPGRDESATQPGMSHEATESPAAVSQAAARARWTKPAAALIAVPLVAVLAWAVITSRSQMGVASGAGSGSASAPQPAPSAPPPRVQTAGEDRTVHVSIEPATADVQVNGQQAAVRDGRVEVRGRPGSVHELTATVDSRETRVRVVITEAGALPATIQVPSATKARAERPPKPARSPTQSAALPPAPAPKPPPPKPGLEHTDKFE